MGQVAVTIVGSAILLLLRSELGETTEVSKACYGPPPLNCTVHDLRCSNGRITIQEAFYMDNTACGNGVSECSYVNLTGIQITGTRYNFSDTELDSLYRYCSIQSQCRLQANRRGTISFSAIIYKCIDATTRTKASPTTAARGTLTSVTPSESFSVVPPDQTTTTTTGVTQTVAMVSTFAGTETNNGMGGMFAAGLVTGFAIAAVMVGVVYVFFIRRRCVIKKPYPGPASPNHPTYTGLTDLGRPDTYDVINRPEAATNPSETSQAPVYQNVNNTS